MKMLHNHFSPSFQAQFHQEPLTPTEAIKTYLVILFGVGLSMIAFYYIVPAS